MPLKISARVISHSQIKNLFVDYSLHIVIAQQKHTHINHRDVYLIHSY
jgi:hypothetical protein